MTPGTSPDVPDDAADGLAPPTDPSPDEVWVSDDGRLFLTGGSHRVLDQITGRMVPDPASVAAFAANTAARAALCDRSGIGFSMWVFPEPLFVQRDTLPELAARTGRLISPYLTHYAPAVAGLPVHYPLATLEGRPACFRRVDSHYSARGFLRIAMQIMDDCHPGLGQAHMRAATDAIAALPPEARLRARSGDLGRKFTPARRERTSVVPPLITWSEVSNGVRGNMGILVLLDSPAGQRDETLLVFGDSYLRSLLPSLAWGWRRILFCRSPFMHDELIAAVRPARIICGTAERYLSAVRPDAARPHVLALPLIAGHQVIPDPGFGQAFARMVDQRAMTGA
jgi:hypothetical protein